MREDSEESITPQPSPVKEATPTIATPLDATLSKPKSLIPSIDIEINVTVNVDSGSIVLHSEEKGFVGA